MYAKDKSKLTQNASENLDEFPTEIAASCSCGIGGVFPNMASLGKCPVGMPWACLRQQCLPFPEATERRRQPRHTNETPTL